jgi:hypothetical protein
MQIFKKNYVSFFFNNSVHADDSFLLKFKRKSIMYIYIYIYTNTMKIVIKLKTSHENETKSIESY